MPKLITLDVRAEIRAGHEPFPRIMEAVARLRDGEQLRIIAPFEPRPLLSVLAEQGYQSTVTPLPEGEFEVIFVPASPPSPEEDLLS